MEFFKAFPIAIIDEDYEGKQAAGRGITAQSRVPGEALHRAANYS